MAYKHGVYVSEQKTAITPPAVTEGCLPVIVGVAPIHLASDPAPVNTPVLCQNYGEAVEQLGYTPNFKNYGIAEAIYTFFALFAVAPVVFINVLDPNKHKKSVSAKSYPVVGKTVTIADDVIKESVKISGLVADTDYTLAYDDNRYLAVSINPSSAHASDSELSISYDAVDPSKVTKQDIIGGIDVETGKAKGLEVINDIYSKLGVVPGQIGAPGFSQDSEVATIMASKAANVSGVFRAYSVVDVDTTETKKYSQVNDWKNSNNIVSENQAVVWPMGKLGDKKLHLSTVLMARQALTTYNNDDIPYKSPSNEDAKIDGLCLEDGTEVDMTLDNANYLNGLGVITCLNFIGGWRTWGNRMACYPANTDPKDAFLCVRAMFNWDHQLTIRTYWQDVDEPLSKRAIQSIVDSENIRLNGLVASGVLIAGKCEYRDSDNPTTSIIDGLSKLHKTYVPPVPNRAIDFVQEFDADAYKATMA